MLDVVAIVMRFRCEANRHESFASRKWGELRDCPAEFFPCSKERFQLKLRLTGTGKVCASNMRVWHESACAGPWLGSFVCSAGASRPDCSGKEGCQEGRQGRCEEGRCQETGQGR